jgi:P27 family predicted phage terminase small subunit
MRYRTPDGRKKVAGTFRPDRSKRQPKADRLKTVPPAPKHLTELARRQWSQIAPLIAEQRTLSPADLPALEQFSCTLATVAQAQAVVEAEGMTIRLDNGAVRCHPAVKILETARAQALRWCVEFGITPRARGHVEPVADSTPGNAFAELA